MLYIYFRIELLFATASGHPQKLLPKIWQNVVFVFHFVHYLGALCHDIRRRRYHIRIPKFDSPKSKVLWVGRWTKFVEYGSGKSNFLQLVMMGYVVYNRFFIWMVLDV